MKIVTHDGTFHADEVFATAVLKEVYPDAVFIRTRDQKTIDDADVVYDVGLEYDGVSKFDHHQSDKLIRKDSKDKIPYSSFGLVWSAFSHQYVKAVVPMLDSSRIDDVSRSIDYKIVLGVDAADNGRSMGKTWDMTRMISSMNSLPVIGLSNDQAFYMAVDLARSVLKSQAVAEYAQVQAEHHIQESFDSRIDQEIVVLPEYCDWNKILLDIDVNQEVSFVVFPNNTNDGYRLMAVPISHGVYASRKLLPMKWSGKTAEQLNKMIGVSDTVFCHTGLFICGFETEDSAVKAAKMAIVAADDLGFPGP
jgi:uncharacterized UPF0160 family protein